MAERAAHVARRAAVGGGVAVLAALRLGPALAQDGPMPVLATFSILADFAREIGGDRIRVTSLIGPDGDAHGFEPSPADAGRVAAGRLVIANGLGFDPWVERLVKAAGSKAITAVASKGIRPLARDQGTHSHGGHDHAGGKHDPHAFGSPALAKVYARNIAAALATADPAGRAAYEAGAARFLAELDRLDAEIRESLTRIPSERRRVVTSHEGFRYFGAEYGLTFVAPRGISSERELSARDLATLVRQIKAERIVALFYESPADERLMRRVASESGAKVGGRLYAEALSGPDGAAPTYLAMMRHNLRTLVTALVP